MPTYEFHCEYCKTHSTEVLSIKRRNDEKICRVCEKPMTRLVGTGANINLKGDGWFKKGWQ